MFSYKILQINEAYFNSSLTFICITVLFKDVLCIYQTSLHQKYSHRASWCFAINKIIEASTKSLVNDYFVYYWTSVAESTVAIYVRSSIN